MLIIITIIVINSGDSQNSVNKYLLSILPDTTDKLGTQEFPV